MRDQLDETGEVERFVWPPRRLQEAVAEADRGIACAERGEGGTEIDVEVERGVGFVPMGTGGDGMEVVGGEAGAQRGRLEKAILEIERVWLGQATPPLGVRIAAAGWAPDRAEAYCWRCGMTVGPHEADSGGCPTCRVRRIGCERIVRLGEFSGLLREVVLEIKFTRWRRLGSQVGQMLGESLAMELKRAGVDAGRVVLVPVPTSFRRRMSRGIDHPLVIARGVAGVTGFPIVRALERKHRPMQHSLPASRRTANLVGAIRLKWWAEPLLEGKHVVLVDDVSTTGATLWASYKAVGGGSRGEGAVRVWAAVVGVTPETGRGGR